MLPDYATHSIVANLVRADAVPSARKVIDTGGEDKYLLRASQGCAASEKEFQGELNLARSIDRVEDLGGNRIGDGAARGGEREQAAAR